MPTNMTDRDKIEFADMVLAMCENIVNDTQLIDHGGHTDGVSDEVIAEMHRVKIAGVWENSDETWTAGNEATASVQTILEHGFALGMTTAGVAGSYIAR